MQHKFGFDYKENEIEDTLCLDGEIDVIGGPGLELSNELEGKEMLEELGNKESKGSIKGKFKNTEEKFKDLITESRDFLLKQSKMMKAERTLILGKRQENILGNTHHFYNLNTYNEQTKDKCLKILRLNGDNTEKVSRCENRRTLYCNTKYYPEKEIENKAIIIKSAIKTKAMDTPINDTMQTDEIFDDYVKNTLSHNNKRDLVGNVAVLTCLRYIELKELMTRLSVVSKRSYGKVSKADFICEITSLTKGFEITPKVMALSNLYDLIQCKRKKRPGIKLGELAGSLSILCKGKTEEKIKLALQYMGVKNITFDDIYNLLVSMFKILLEQVPNSLRNENISVNEIAKMTTLQYFEDCKVGNQSTVQEFISWFSSQARTLTLEYVLSNSPKAKTEIKSYKREKFSDSIVYTPNNPIGDDMQSKGKLYTEVKGVFGRVGVIGSVRPFLLEDQFIPCSKDLECISTIGQNTSRRDNSIEVTNGQSTTRAFIDMIPQSICESSFS